MQKILYYTEDSEGFSNGHKPRTLEGYRLTPYIVLLRVEPGLYSVTHSPTGCAMVEAALPLKLARKIASELAEIPVNYSFETATEFRGSFQKLAKEIQDRIAGLFRYPSDILGPDYKSLKSSGKRTRLLREECLQILGRQYSDKEVRVDIRCQNKACCWHNEDGTTGCNDKRALTFDHTEGGGSKLRTANRENGNQIYYAIKKNPERFRLLCATCHEIRKKADNQCQGARLHRQPARVRSSQQRDDETVRRVRTRQDNADKESIQGPLFDLP